MNKKELTKFVENYIENSICLDWNDKDDISELSLEIEREFDTDFSIEVRGNDCDFWLQVEYYSKKLNKAIIFDYNFIDSFDGVDEFVDVYLETQKAVEEFEKKISFNNKEKIEVGIYWNKNKNGEKIFDEDSIRDEFEEKLKSLL